MAFGSLGNPLEYFQIGQGLGTANAPSMAGPQSVMDMFKAQQENQMKLAQTAALFKAQKDYEWQNDPERDAKIANYKANTAYTNRALSQMPGSNMIGQPTLGSGDESNPGMIFTGMNGKNAQFSSPQGMRQKGQIENEISAQGKIIDAGGKLGSAVKRLNIINEQLNTALPASPNPLVQRIQGPLAVAGAKTGLMPNPRLLALKKNIRPIGIQLIRAFGEVGNLSEPEQQSSMDVVSNENLSPDERLASIKQFAEFALAGARPEALDFMMKDPALTKIVKDLGINIPYRNPIQQSSAVRNDTAPDASTTSPVNMLKENSIMKEKIASGKYDINKLKNIYKQRTGQDYA